MNDTPMTEAELRRYPSLALAYQQLAEARQRAEDLEHALRRLASYVSAGGFNADHLSADELEAKVRWGIDVEMDNRYAVQEDLKACQAALSAARTEADGLRIWRDAVLDHCVTSWVPATEQDNPWDVVRMLLENEARWALDPTISEDAQRLIAKGAATALENRQSDYDVRDAEGGEAVKALRGCTGETEPVTVCLKASSR